MPIIERTDEDDDEDSDSDSDTFYPIDLGKRADSGSFGTGIRRESIGRGTEILVETESERDDGGDGQNNEDFIGVGGPAKLKERLRFLCRYSVLSESSFARLLLAFA